MLRLAKSLALPTEAVTQAIGILAKRRAGKSYTARRLVEQLVHAHQQVVIVDPKGDWWGIRAAANGKDPGLPVTILGGERGDVPLEKAGGELVAKLIVEDQVSALLDVSIFRKRELAVFLGDFLEALYHMKAREIYRTPLMLVLDEADAIAPQKPNPGEERMLGACEDIVRRGGQRGLGCTLITQRSAVLNKNVLTQVQALIALRTIAPQDLKALNAWIDVHGTDEERKTLMASLPSLPTGDAWVWSPGWPTTEGIFERVRVLPIETFDSGATPKPGEKRTEPRKVADVDLEALRRQMADVVKRAEDSDPKALRARAQKAERELEQMKRTATKAPTKRAIVAEAGAVARLRRALETAMQFIIKINAEQFFQAAAGASLDPADIQKALDATAATLARLVEQKLDARNLQLERLQREAERIIEALKKAVGDDVTLGLDVRHNAPVSVTSRTRPVEDFRPQTRRENLTRQPLPPTARGGEARMRAVLAQHYPRGLQEGAWARLAALKASGGTWGDYKSRLKVRGEVELRTDGLWYATEAGVDAAGVVPAMPSSPAEILAMWESKPGMRQPVRLVRVVVEHGGAMPLDDLAAASGLTVSGGTFGDYLSRVRTAGLLATEGRVARAAEELLG